MPSPWTPGTSRAGDPGRIAVLFWDNGQRASLSPIRLEAGGGLVAVSAVDGSYRYLDLPGFVLESGAAPSLSPDGRYVAYPLRSGGPDDPAAVTTGWRVYDAQTGRTVDHRPRDVPKGLGQVATAWSPDSRTLLVDVCRVTQVDASSQSCETRRTDLWDVASGEVREVAGPIASEVVGSLDDDLVLLGQGRGRRLSRLDVGSGATTPLGRLASLGPRASEERVRVDPGSGTATVAATVQEAQEGHFGLRLVEQPLNGSAGSAPQDVVTDTLSVEPVVLPARGRVVGLAVAANGETTFLEVGPERGDEQDLVRLGRYGGSLPQVATDLVSRPTVSGVRPPEIRDPRKVSGGVTLAVLVLAGVVVAWWRRRRSEGRRA
jgi:hypothetical protein